MYRTATAMLWNDADAADAMQECILKAWAGRNSLRDASRLDGWMMRILINECRNIQRRRRRAPLPIEEAEAAVAPAEDQGLQEALRLLPESYRLPLVLHHLNGLELPEVAHALRLPVSTVKGRLFRARRMLRDMLQEEVE